MNRKMLTLAMTMCVGALSVSEIATADTPPTDSSNKSEMKLPEVRDGVMHSPAPGPTEKGPMTGNIPGTHVPATVNAETRSLDVGKGNVVGTGTVRSTDPTRENPNGETRLEVGAKMNLDKSPPAATPSAPAREHHAAPEPHEGGGGHGGGAPSGGGGRSGGGGYAGPDHPDHSNTA
jgi:hypothetical protein